MGSRRGKNKCTADLAEVLVFDSMLPEADLQRVTQHLAAKYRLGLGTRALPQDASGDTSKRLASSKNSETIISKPELLRRLRSMPHLDAVPHRTRHLDSARVDIPKWLHAYGQSMEVVDSMALGLPLPRWFVAEIEPVSHDPWRESSRDLSLTSLPPAVVVVYMMQHTATHCNTLQHSATHATLCNTCNTL